MTETKKPAVLTIRNARMADLPAISALVAKVYKTMPAYSDGMLRGQISGFRDGQFVVEYEGDIVGYAAGFRIDEKTALAPHTWSAITGGGYAARHDPAGDWFYGMEVCVDPDRRRLRIGQRLYDARRDLCESLNLKGIVFGGRMPGLARRKKEFSDPQDYLDAVTARRISDPVIGFHLRSGFEPIGVLNGYLPSDAASLGHAAHMVWAQPLLCRGHRQGRGLRHQGKRPHRHGPVPGPQGLVLRRVHRQHRIFRRHHLGLSFGLRRSSPSCSRFSCWRWRRKRLTPAESIEAS
jgi:GNAT superfamily N-acetyltransferase